MEMKNKNFKTVIIYFAYTFLFLILFQQIFGFFKIFPLKAGRNFVLSNKQYQFEILPVTEKSQESNVIEIKNPVNPFNASEYSKYISNEISPKVKFDYKLSAIVIENNERAALLTNEKKQTLTVKTGDIVKGWKVISITEDSITLSGEETSLTLNLW